MIPLQISPFQYVANGVVFSSIIVLAAIGLSLVYSIADFANFAHGDLMTVGAFSALFSVGFFRPMLGDAGVFGLPLWFFLALAFGMGAAAVIAVLTNRVVYRPVKDSGSIGLLISSIGVALVYRALVFLSFGTEPERYGVSRQGPIPWVRETLGIAVTPRNLVVVALTVVLVTALHLTLTRTTLGRKMRATADNADLARVSGIRTGEVIFAMWLIGGALAAAGGVFLGLEELVRPRMGFDILLIVFAAVILGGIGSVYGAMLGGLVIGMVHELVPLFYQWGIIPVRSRYAAAVAFVIMVAILLVRPSGIAGDNG
ncbi:MULTISPECIES: branched-chain amino acid ABC transporter permease [Haloferax]|uniref:Branched-chain amino acid ABC transporter permease n=4 Tax=Haloferax TaxID=2251 RepID=A0A6C0UUR5_HALVO|nr:MULTISPECIES: branched-chain amino acid ABC transporter permease [Haloferax]ELK55494.1 branched chain amino acid transporter permease protein [Haloferax sp. BAB-2207]ELZ73581.1 branched chain amino acid transporter permease protein [Haloferax lucentense DSM 14919]ELZ93511.1 branched chain amino acid transporter permease protein [Haloferax alexandrinus JCM 10717]NLV02110.1 branched-chain amino acid ABC transporter permease [Haloferax alexandrinus]QIB78293.1 branched-chain amino acid ABC tran